MLNIINWTRRSAKHIATDSGVSISYRDRNKTARCSVTVAQTRLRQHLAKIYPNDKKDLQLVTYGQSCMTST